LYSHHNLGTVNILLGSALLGITHAHKLPRVERGLICSLTESNMSERSARHGKRSEPFTKQTRQSTSQRGVVSTSTRSTNSTSTRSTGSASTCYTVTGSTSGPSGELRLQP